MTQVAATPRATLNLSIKIGEDEYQLHVSECTITPNTIPWHGGTPTANFADFTWKLRLVLVHDYQNAESLYNFLLDHAGEAATFAYKPDEAGTFGRSVDATIIPPAVGGKVNAFNESTVEMECSAPVDSNESA